MNNLEALSSIARLSDNVVRVLGQNPGKFTLQGTNTYIIGKRNPYVLVDTAEGREEYIAVLESALRETAVSSNTDEPHISDIILSHWHQDHVRGLPSVLALLRRLWDEREHTGPFEPPRLHKFPIPAGTFSPKYQVLSSVIDHLLVGSFTPTVDGKPLHDLTDFQQFMNLRVLHTPGHTIDSICLYIPDDEALYTADSVLGQGTAVFEDLSRYISSLRKMLDFGKDPQTPYPYRRLYPGHGPVVEDGEQVISTYIRHRIEREDQIIALLRSPNQTTWTTWSLVSKIYSAYPESLWLPAAHSVDLHLKKLEKDGVVNRLGGADEHTNWGLTLKL
ncbi:lactamase [Guyanagaster necrorhizus]|uniref:Lactamase n=1 Tax=Guyanagaster necrorhizus TaxID=856835 RepID=A0A9P7VG24_9AGAR|nr:lactamase [Guyanagaster necrorhizus MCA 3950]KAG7440049.1 lactamase [Guyanagaster necrorhizus MCA 3950]